MKYWFYMGYAPKYCLKNVFLLHVLNENEIIINAGYWVLSENCKHKFPARKISFPQNTKNY